MWPLKGIQILQPLYLITSSAISNEKIYKLKGQCAPILFFFHLFIVLSPLIFLFSVCVFSSLPPIFLSLQ